MTLSERWHRIEALFEQAHQLAPSLRASFLEQQCGDDAELKAEVESLLAQCERMDDRFLEPPARWPGAAGEGSDDPLIGTRVGRFEIVRLIGRGGMGAVYEARQDPPRRTVALKVLWRHRFSRRVLARFHSEAEILARMRHPAVAHVYDAGTEIVAGVRVPYFAMEYVPDARSITQYSRDQCLSLHRRLELFADVCDAVHHGHQKGIIHRDLKPANILVGNDGQPKVIDFGVARVTDSDVARTTQQTQVGEIVGTLQYMSPEQCAGHPDAIDTRSDVYALGVVLYEVLSGALPYETGSSTLGAITHTICEQAPRRLSEVVPRLSGDIETIVHKALEKDPTRRYQSAEALADDIRRFLHSEPISARPPSTFYLASRYVRRHKGASAAAAAALVILLVALAAVSRFAYRTEQARVVAENARTTAEQERRKAVFREYNARIAAAEAALAGFDPMQAIRVLDDPNSIPAELRGWEWYHLRGRVSQSMGVLRVGMPLRRLNVDTAGGHLLLTEAQGTVCFLGIPAGDAECPSVDNASPHWSVGGSAGGETQFRNAAFSPDGRFLISNMKQAAPAGPGAAHAEVGSYLDVWEYVGDRPQLLAVCRELTKWPFVRRVHQFIGPVDGYALRVAAHPCEPVFAIGNESLGLSLCRLPDPLPPAASRVPPTADRARPIMYLGAHGRGINWMEFNPAGTLLASGGEDHTTRIWDVERALADAAAQPAAPGAATSGVGQPYELCVLLGQPDHILSGDFSPDGRRLATSSVDATIWIWQIPPLEELRAGARPEPIGRLAGHKGPVHSVVFDSTGQWLYSAGADRTVRVWNVREDTFVGDTGQRQFARRPSRRLVNTLRGHSGRIAQVDSLPDGRIVSVSEDGTARFWYPWVPDIPDFREHFSSVVSVAFSPDDRHVLSVGGDGALMIWDPDTTLPVARKYLPANCSNGVVAWRHGKHNWAATTTGYWRMGMCADTGAVEIWHIDELPDLHRTWDYSPPWDDCPMFYGLAVSANGRRLAAGDARGRIHVWDISSLPDPAGIHKVAVLESSRDAAVWNLAWLDSAGNWLVSGLMPREYRDSIPASSVPSACVWEVDTARAIPLTGHPGEALPSQSVAVSPRRDVLAVLYRNGGLWTYAVSWDHGRPRLGKPQRLAMVEKFACGLTFHPDPASHRLLLGERSGSIRIWDYVERVELASLRGPVSSINHLAFDSRGRRLASASAGVCGAENVVFLWETLGRQERARLARLRSRARRAQEMVWQLLREATGGPEEVRARLEHGEVQLPDDLRDFALEHFSELECDVNWYWLAGMTGTADPNMPREERLQRLEWLEAAHRRAPEHRQGWPLLAATYYHLGRAEADQTKADEWFRKGLELLRIDGPEPDRYMNCYPSAHAVAALLHHALGNRAAARLHLERAEGLARDKCGFCYGNFHKLLRLAQRTVSAQVDARADTDRPATRPAHCPAASR